MVAELLEGETLRERMRSASIPLSKTVGFALELAEGLAAAHAKGIVHRDLKPENIFVTNAGHAKILDFGLARVNERDTRLETPEIEYSPTVTLVTRAGMIVGTLNYMSPEQVRGLRIDARSDIFSFGCVLYEMMTGRRAFSGATPADTMTCVLKEEPEPLEPSRLQHTPELERIVTRCLEKQPEQRFQTASDLAFSLRSIVSKGKDEKDGSRRRRIRLARVTVALFVLVVIVVGSLVGWRQVRREKRPAVRQSQAPIGSLAVLPFVNASGDPDQEYFVDGMTDALIADMAKVRTLRVISRTSVMQYKSARKALPDIARELKVDAVVEGSVLRVGDRVRITAQLLDARADRHLWAESYERELRDVLRLHNEVARAIASEIKVTLTPQEHAQLYSSRPVNPAAHEAYLRGRFHWHSRTRAGMQKAIEYFRQAIELDAQYAPAYAGLADCHSHMARHGHVAPKEAFPLAKQAALQAVKLDDGLAEVHGALAVIALYFDWDWATAEGEIRRALDINESYEEAHHQYSHLLLTLHRQDESLAHSQRALELNPLDPLLNVHLGWHYMMVREYDQAITLLKSVLDVDPSHYQALRHIGWAYMYDSHNGESIAALEAATRLAPDSAQAMTALAAAHAAAGRDSDARALLQQLQGTLAQRYVSPCDIAAVHAALNEIDVALDWLEKAYEERSPRIVELGMDSVFDPLRSDPRFEGLLRRMNLRP
jgi:TolB-like protein